MKTTTIATTLFLIVIALLLSSCTLRNNADSTTQSNTSVVIQTEAPKEPPAQVYDYDVILSDNARDVPPLISLSPDIEKIFKVTNKRNTEAVFEIPQADIYERLYSGEVKYIAVRPVRIGFYQMKLNGASYGTFQVK